MNLENLFNPKSVAIIGASPEDGKVGNVIAKNVLELGYRGEVYLVNPKYDEIFGRKCYKKLSEIENPVDLAVMAIPAKFIPAEILESSEKIKNYVIISAGFSEIGEEGKEREEQIKKIAKEKGLNILGPNCLGFVAPKIKLNATFASGMPAAGNVALLSQSGALIVAIMDIAKDRNINFSHIVSIGNKMTISETEMLEHLDNDPEVKVIGMYLEGIGNGRKFLETASRVVARKPIVIIKSGKTEKSQMAISSHTGALAGSDEIMSAVFSKAGIIRAQSTEEFFNLLSLFSQNKEPNGENIAIITNAGGPGVLATDAFKGKEIKMADISRRTKEKLKEFLPLESSVENPVDVLGDAKEDRYKKTLSLLGKDKDINSIVCVLTPQDQTPVGKIASKIIQFNKKSEKLVVTVFMGGERVKKASKKLQENGVPNFKFPEEAINAINSYSQWVKTRAAEITGEVEINTKRQKDVMDIINVAKGEGRGALFFSDARWVMDVYGINAVDSWEDGKTGEIKFPVAVKVDSDKVLHKTDKKGLILDIKDSDELNLAVNEMKNNFPGEKIIIQPMLERKVELILGIKKDGVFGPIIVFGLGGIYTEVFHMVDFLVPPLNLAQIKESLLRSKIGFLFRETRGQRPYDIESLAKALLGISQLAVEIPEIKEFDINPMLIYNDGREAVTVDVKIIL
ncbi:MAG TPA: acetate--CoA ligase family protein [Candidatus Moranbacteria bacterium]|nr:acetate--CoA ligase family protein [Candidatus Moranbacteria bacterium]